MSTTMENADQLDRMGIADTFLAQLAGTVGNGANASMVFGEPVEQGGITVIPVAKVGWGGGIGGFSAALKNGGAGMYARPLGYIEVRDGEARFRRIYDTGSMILVVIAMLLLLRGIRKLISG